MVYAALIVWVEDRTVLTRERGRRAQDEIGIERAGEGEAQELASQRKLKHVLTGLLLAIDAVERHTGKRVDMTVFMAQFVSNLVMSGGGMPAYTLRQVPKNCRACSPGRTTALQPNAIFTRPEGVSNPRFVELQQAWRRAWVNACDQFEMWWQNAFHAVQNNGRGLLAIGTREWRDYTVQASIRTDFAGAIGLAARVNGLKRFYAVLLRSDGTIQIIKALNGDQALAEGAYAWEPKPQL